MPVVRIAVLALTTAALSLPAAPALATGATVTAVSPTSAVPASGTLRHLTISGSGFSASPTVTVGSLAVSHVVDVDATQVTADLAVPPGTPLGARTVTVDDGSLAGAFTVLADPGVTTTLPGSVTTGAVEPAAASTTITGTSAALAHQQLTYDLSGITGLTAADVSLRCQPDDGSTALSDVSLTASAGHLVGTCGDFTLGAGATRTTAVRIGLAAGTPSGTLTVAMQVGDTGVGDVEASASGTTSVVGVPAAPTGVAASVDDAQSSVSFTPGDLGGSSVTWTATACGQSATGPSSPLLITGLTNGTTCSVTVAGTNASGPGPASTAVTVRPYAPSSAPRDVSVAPGDGTLSVSFDPPTTNPGVVAGYTASACGETATGTSSPLLVSGLTNGTTCAVTVTATDVEGASVTSAAVPGAAYAIPSAPTGVTATPGDGAVTVTFAPPAVNAGVVTGYVATATPSDGGTSVTATGPTSPVTVGGLTDGRSYALTLAAQTSAMDLGPASGPVTATPRGVPGVTGAPLVLAGEQQVLVSFTGAADRGAPITGWTATATPVLGGAAVTASGAGSPLLVPGLVDGVAYVVTVSATNAAGAGPASSASAPVTPSPRPTLGPLRAPGKVTVDQPFLMTGRTSQPLQLVDLVDVLTPGGAVVVLGTVTSDASGAFALHVRATRTGRVHAAVAGLDAGGAFVATSGSVLVTVRSLARITSATVAGTHLVVRGTLSPGQLVKVGSAYAKLSVWLVDARGRRLVRLGRGTAAKAPRSSAASPFRLVVGRPPPGTRRVVVVVDVAAQSSGAVSAPVTLLVT